MLTIAYKDYDDDIFYLNHACMKTLVFGDIDMAWVTDDRELAERTLARVKKKHGPTQEFEIVPIVC